MKYSIDCWLLCGITLITAFDTAEAGWHWHIWQQNHIQPHGGCVAGHCVRKWECPKGHLILAPTGSCAYLKGDVWVCCHQLNPYNAAQNPRNVKPNFVLISKPAQGANTQVSEKYWNYHSDNSWRDKNPHHWNEVDDSKWDKKDSSNWNTGIDPRNRESRTKWKNTEEKHGKGNEGTWKSKEHENRQGNDHWNRTNGVHRDSSWYDKNPHHWNEVEDSKWNKKDSSSWNTGIDPRNRESRTKWKNTEEKHGTGIEGTGKSNEFENKQGRDHWNKTNVHSESEEKNGRKDQEDGKWKSREEDNWKKRNDDKWWNDVSKDHKRKPSDDANGRDKEKRWRNGEDKWRNWDKDYKSRQGEDHWKKRKDWKWKERKNQHGDDRWNRGEDHWKSEEENTWKNRQGEEHWKKKTASTSRSWRLSTMVTKPYLEQTPKNRRIPAFFPTKSTSKAVTMNKPNVNRRVTTPVPDINEPLCGFRESDSVSLRHKGNSFEDASVIYPDLKSSYPVDAIMGGEEVKPFSWPWVAALYRVTTTDQRRFLSAGSLINTNFILTAAHAFKAKDLRSPSFVVMLGTHTTNEAIATYAVESILPHPDYETKYYYHDIALLRLERPVVFNEFVVPICLPSPSSKLLKDEDLVGKNVTVMGWGDESFGGVSSRVLKEATFPIVSRKICNSSYTKVASNRFPRGITEDMICASDPKGGKDACQGDSGGPLTLKEGERYTQVGIVSFGYQCGDKEYPGVYTKVQPYLSWIAKSTRKRKDYDFG